jgi:hypothetical protein
MSTTKIYEPLTPPSEKKALSQPPLTPEQTKMQADVQAHFDKPDYVIPGVEGGKLMEEEKFWLSYECQLRCIYFSFSDDCNPHSQRLVALQVPARHKVETGRLHPKDRVYIEMEKGIRSL